MLATLCYPLQVTNCRKSVSDITADKHEITSSVDMRQVQVGISTGNPRNQHTDIRRDHELGTADQLSRNPEPCWKTKTTQ